jgi:hypothetical protein
VPWLRKSTRQEIANLLATHLKNATQDHPTDDSHPIILEFRSWKSAHGVLESVCTVPDVIDCEFPHHVPLIITDSQGGSIKELLESKYHCRKLRSIILSVLSTYLDVLESSDLQQKISCLTQPQYRTYSRDLTDSVDGFPRSFPEILSKY